MNTTVINQKTLLPLSLISLLLGFAITLVITYQIHVKDNDIKISQLTSDIVHINTRIDDVSANQKEITSKLDKMNENLITVIAILQTIKENKDLTTLY